MQAIDVDFEVFKKLTARREHEGHTYNDVLREVLGLKPTLSRTIVSSMASIAHTDKQKAFALRGGELVDGTELRAVYKGKSYRASIRDGSWVDSSGEERSSPSAAATVITGTNVNGLRFWDAKRPTPREYTRLDVLLAMQT